VKNISNYQQLILRVDYHSKNALHHTVCGLLRGLGHRSSACGSTLPPPSSIELYSYRSCRSNHSDCLCRGHSYHHKLCCEHHKLSRWPSIGHKCDGGYRHYYCRYGMYIVAFWCHSTLVLTAFRQSARLLQPRQPAQQS
jgi:hypothetical protein